MRIISSVWIRAALPAALVFAAFAFPASATADIYSWTDRNGIKHFSSDPPPKGEQISDLRVMKTVEEPEEVEAGDSDKAVADTTRKEAQKNAPKVDIYVDSQSEICREALGFFDQRKIPYTKHEVDVDPEARQRYKSLEGQGVPLVFIGDHRMDGWDEPTAMEYLGIP
jgi:hypothetical protein